MMTMPERTPKTVTREELRFAVLAVDVVLFTVDDEQLKVLLMNVQRPPHFVDVPGFPGGLIDPAETADEAAARQLRQKGCIDPQHVYMEQLYTFSRVDRDPRGRVVSVAYLALLPSTRISAREEDETWWCAADEVPALAYDHDEVFQVALSRLRSRIGYTNIVVHLMPDTFTLTELQRTYEIVLGRSLDKRNFRKKIRDADLVTPTGRKRRGLAHRPAALYVMAQRRVREVDLF